MNSPLFLYYPLHGDFRWGAQPLPDAGPAMAWYGLMAKAALVATAAALCVPDRLLGGVLRNCAWLFAVAAMLVCVFLLRKLFLN